jgi:hypothetical protein
MAVYRFRVSFEDYDDVIREIDIKSNQTFKDLHYAIHKSIGYDPEKSSSFYVSNDHWIKNEEIAYLPSEKKIDRGVSLMENAKLSSHIDDPHQKFYYIYNFEKPFDFHVELIKILENNPTQTYPLVFKSVGEAPKIISNILGSPDEITGDEDPDFLDDETILIADEDELEALNSDTEEGEDEEEESDEFSDEFSDNENYDQDDYDRE